MVFFLGKTDLRSIYYPIRINICSIDRQAMLDDLTC